MNPTSILGWTSRYIPESNVGIQEDLAMVHEGTGRQWAECKLGGKGRLQMMETGGNVLKNTVCRS